jgi:hypothetical protein
MPPGPSSPRGQTLSSCHSSSGEARTSWGSSRPSSQSSQGGRVVEPGETIEDGLRALLARLAEEIAFNEAKGTAPYRLGMHDGLRFAEDAVADILRWHGHRARTDHRAIDA